MSNDSTSTSTVMYVVVVVVAVLVASVLAPVVWSATQGGDSERSSVAVITLRGGTSGANVAAVSEDLRHARNNDSIEAVVLRIDSPGGAVTSSEEFYLAVNRTAAEMPVVSYVEGAAASGGYYGIVPSDHIYVKPSSQVGSIGVIVQAPPSLVEQQGDITDSFIRTGPDKAQVSVQQLRTQMESLQNSFVGTVMEHRGDEITLTREEVGQGNAYLGTVAVENGFADDIGSLESAIAHAAEASDDIDGDNYDVTYMEPPQTSLGLLLGGQDVERIDDGIVVVTPEDGQDVEFVRPRFYAVYGVPQLPDDSEEVVVNETR